MPEIGQVDHVITDPPYSDEVHAKPWQSKALNDAGDPRCGSAHAGLGFAALTADQRALVAIHPCARWRLVFADLEGIDAWRKAFGAAAVDNVRVCIWDKIDSAPQFTGDRPAAGAEAIVCAHSPGRKRWNGGGRRNVFRSAVNAERGGKPHPSTKPLGLMLDLVELFTGPGDLVLDPFCGSGTTGIACVRIGRRFIGIERKPEWAELSRERIRAELAGSDYAARSRGQGALFG
jgi:site-specific DNA-methyltransferase (adenine-specific)